MIEVLITIDLAAIRGGYYKQPARKGRVFPVGGQSGNYYSQSDKHYKGRHPFNILTEEVLND